MVGVQGQWSLVEVVVTNFNGGSMLSICDYGGFGGGWHYLMDDEFQLWMSFSLKLLSKLVEWKRNKDDWRRHFKEKMSQEQAHHHRKSWIRA